MLARPAPPCQGYSWAEDKEHCEEYGRMLNADPSKVGGAPTCPACCLWRCEDFRWLRAGCSFERQRGQQCSRACGMSWCARSDPAACARSPARCRRAPRSGGCRRWARWGRATTMRRSRCGLGQRLGWHMQVAVQSGLACAARHCRLAALALLCIWPHMIRLALLGVPCLPGCRPGCPPASPPSLACRSLTRCSTGWRPARWASTKWARSAS